MTYNLTNIENTTGLDNFIGAVNSEANGLPGLTVVILLWIGVFVYASNRNLNPGESYLTASFVTSIVGGLMYFTGMITLTTIILLVVMLFIGLVVQMFK